MSWDNFIYLKKNQFKYPDKMDMNFLTELDKYIFSCIKYAAYKHGISKLEVVVTSSYRNPEENQKADGVKNSAHTEVPCKAVDLWIKNNVADSIKIDILVRNAILLNINRIGIYPNKDCVHIDMSNNLPSPRIWRK